VSVLYPLSTEKQQKNLLNKIVVYLLHSFYFLSLDSMGCKKYKHSFFRGVVSDSRETAVLSKLNIKQKYKYEIMSNLSSNMWEIIPQKKKNAEKIFVKI